MSENKESNNVGCLIGIIIFVIVSIIYFFATTSADTIAENGRWILAIAGLVGSYFVCKALFGNKSYKSSWGCILTGIVCLIITGVIVGVLTSSFSFNYVLGVVVFVVFAIVVGIVAYNSFKD